jgi:hypothetical protein
MGLKESVKQALRMCGDAMASTVHDRLAALENNVKDLAGTQSALLESSIHILETLPQMRQAVFVDATEPAPVTAEMGLTSFLAAFLPDRCAVEIGAQSGDWSERLLKAGYQVYAIEANAQHCARLCERLKAYPQFRALNFPLSGDGAGVRTLDDLRRSQTIPAGASLLKLAAPGHELDVIDGMARHPFPAVILDCGAELLRADAGTSPSADALRALGYSWWITLYRSTGQDPVSFLCNQEIAFAKSWGRMFFFRDRETFVHAETWCASALPRTYFRS